MAGIFISYRRDDSGGYSGRLAQDLRGAFGNASVFIDLHLRAGSDFVREIERQIATCDCVVALIGTRWLAATDAHGKRRLDDPQDFLRMELVAALERGVLVIPALVQDAALPRADQLPEPLRALLKHQAIELTDQHWEQDVGRMIEAVALARGRGHRPWRWLHVALACVAVAAVGLGLAARFGSPAQPTTELPPAAALPEALARTRGPTPKAKPRRADLDLVRTDNLYAAPALKALLEGLEPAVAACFDRTLPANAASHWQCYDVTITSQGKIDAIHACAKPDPVDACMEPVLRRLSPGPPANGRSGTVRVYASVAQ